MNDKNNLFLNISKLILMITPVVHLLFCTMHIDALTKLSSQLSGFAMFMFILIGLMVLFNATRVSQDLKIKNLITSTICALLCSGFGVWLIIFYLEGSVTNVAADSTTVTMAMLLSILVIAALITGIVFLFLAKFFNGSKKEKVSGEVETNAI